MQRLLTAQEIDTLQARRPELFEPPELTGEQWRAATSSRNGKRGPHSRRFWIDAEMFLSDLRYLTHWERGVWINLQSLMWLREGCSLPDNETSIARALDTSVQRWRQLRWKLLTRKLLVKRDGLLYIVELFLQHKHSEKTSATASRNATQGWRKRRQNGGKSLGEKDGKHADATRAHA